MQYCAAPLSFVLTAIRGPDAQSAICGSAAHTRAVVTGWWQDSFGRLIAHFQDSLRLGQQQFIQSLCVFLAGVRHKSSTLFQSEIARDRGPEALGAIHL